MLEQAIGYAENGYPVIPGMTATIERTEPLAARPGRRRRSSISRLRGLERSFATLRSPRPIGESSRRPARGAARTRIDRARDAFYRGFVADEIDRFSSENGGLLAGGDLAGWEATVEPPVTYDYLGYTVCKTGPWGQGPVFLQQLALLAGLDLPSLDIGSAEYVHTIVECAKLAFADRDAFYGDPNFVDVPLDRLLSPRVQRRAPPARGRVGLGGAPAGRRPAPDPGRRATSTVGAGEPTRGDTVHLDVADRFGNLVSATPSGGWLQSSPVIPALGWPLGTRAQMFWLEEGLPASLAPGKRPRTTLSPSIALREGEPYLAFGTPGGDQQDQWSLHVFLNHVHGGLDLQASIDRPNFHTDHFPASFYPRQVELRSLSIEDRFGRDVLDDLRDRGHDVEAAGDWSLGRVSAVGREDGTLKAGASPRGMQGYAVGR